MTKKKISYGFATRAIHSGAAPEPITGARNTPIYQTTSYVFKNTEHAERLFKLEDFGFIYSRLTNPTVSVLEERLANLENSRAAVACSSGHASQQLAFASLLSNNDHFIASDKLYGGSITQFTKTFKSFGWETDLVDITNYEEVKQAIKSKNVRALFAESLSNPEGVVSDITQLSEIAHDEGIPLIIDNTMATQAMCQPANYGADIIIYSTTKFLSGHGNAMGGCVVDTGKFDWANNRGFEKLNEPDTSYHGIKFYETFGNLAYINFCHACALRDLGTTMSPFNAYLTLTGIETLNLRMQKHMSNAEKVANFLIKHNKVDAVSWSGFQNNKSYKLAKKYFKFGFGSVFTFSVKSGYDGAKKVVENCNLFSHLANVGDTKSLIIHPASTTHRQLSSEQREISGAGDSVIRLSIGIEHSDDIIKDLKTTLDNL